MKKFLTAFIAMGALFAGCSSESAPDQTLGDNAIVTDKPIAAKGESMWSALQRMGVSEYFDSLSQSGVMPMMASSAGFGGACSSPALKMDENTRYLDELESVFDEGEQVKGVCGNALKLNDGQVAPLGVNLIDSLSVGTVEFWFRPNEDFLDAAARTLLGNDGSRVHFFYKNGELYFQKNHADQHFFVKGAVALNDDWNLIAGQWGDGYMSLWVNGTMVAKMKHSLGYAPARRNKPFENLLVIGYKSYCCMEGAGQFEGMTTSGAFDQFRISNIPRYKVEEEIVDEPTEPDTVAVDSLPVDVPDTTVTDTTVTDTTVADTTVADTTVADTTVTDTTVADSAVADTTVTDTTAADTIISFDTEFDGGVIYIDTTIMIPIIQRDSL